MRKSLIPILISLLVLPSYAFSAASTITVMNCRGELLASESIYGDAAPTLRVLTSNPKATEVRLSTDLNNLSAEVINGTAVFSQVPIGSWRACTQGEIDSVVFGDSYDSSLFQMASAAIGGGAALGGIIMAFDESSSDGVNDPTVGSPSVSSAETGSAGTTAAKPPRPFAAEENCLNDEDAPEIEISPSS